MRILKTKIIKLIGLVLLAASNQSFGQYFNNLYDIDSNADWATNVIIQPDNNYFLKGTSYNPVTSNWFLFNMQLSANGNDIISKHMLKVTGASIYGGNFGEMKKLPNGNYVFPITIQSPNIGYQNSEAGLMKINTTGDTILFRRYTDTSSFFENLFCIDVASDGSYILGGDRSINTPYHFPGLILRTDSLGDTLWTRTYQKDTSQWVIINNIIAMPDGRMVVGAQSTYWANPIYAYTHNTPWFMILDKEGNILKDTLYGAKYAGGGYLYADKFGGYFHTGNIDSLVTGNPNEWENFPDYIAHLDTNFRMDWITRFPYFEETGHRYISHAIQTSDGNFIVAGQNAKHTLGKQFYGWAAKIDRSGNMLWEHYYISDSFNDARFTGAMEKPDKTISLIGSSFNSALPAWHYHLDAWLVSVDSNGCELPGCATKTNVNELPAMTNGEIVVYPNPTSGSLTIATHQAGQFELSDLLGRQLKSYQIHKGESELQLPANLASGVYLGVFKYQDGSLSKTIRLVYTL